MFCSKTVSSFFLLVVLLGGCSVTREVVDSSTELTSAKSISCRDTTEPTPIEYCNDSGPVYILSFTVKTYSDAQFRDCDSEHVECYRNCMNAPPKWPLDKGSSGHKRRCSYECLKEYMECIAANSLRRSFESVAEAARWLYRHPAAVGSILIIGTVAFVVIATDGAGLVLVPYVQDATKGAL